MFDVRERVMLDEAEKMIEDLKKCYVEDGFSEDIARSMAIADLKLDYEIL